MKAQKKQDLIALVRAGFRFRDIGRRLGIHRDTVSRYARAAGLWPSDASDEQPKWPPDPPELRRSLCEPHRDWIEIQVGLGRNAVSIYQNLVDEFGFEGRYNSVKRFVRALKKVQPTVYDVLEFKPGEEAQVDYGQGAPTRHPKSGRYVRPLLFIMVMRYSGRAFRKTVFQTDQVAWARLHEEAFRYFGGVPQYVVLDNLKEGVIRPDLYEPELNATYAERTVGTDGLVQVRQAYYGAPPSLVGKSVPVRIFDTAFAILNPDTLETERYYNLQEKGTFSIRDEDRIFNPSRETERLLERVSRIGPNTEAFARELLREQGRPAQRRLQGLAALARRHDRVDIEWATTIALRRALLSCRAVRLLLERKQRDAAEPQLVQEHHLIRQASEYHDLFNRIVEAGR